MQQENQNIKQSKALEIQKMQADVQKSQLDAQMAQQRMDLDAKKVEIEAYKAMTERMQVDQMVAGPLPPEPSPFSISLPDQLGASLAQSMAPILAQTVHQTVSSLPPMN